MPEIQTLVKDIYATIKRKDWFTEELARDYADNLGKKLRSQLSDDRTSRRGSLRLSGMGPKCPRALWYSVHHPELAEPLPPQAEIKYSFGHMIEALAIVLAKASGHTVTGEQDALELDGIIGHRDCVIDGAVVDVKSASSISFQKFKSAQFDQMDSFGYLDQLDGYVVASHDDPLVTVKDRGFLLVVDKQLGTLYLYEHLVRERSIRDRISLYRAIVAEDVPPACECRTISQGKSGNIELDIKAGYSAYKHCCFDGVHRPKIRTFLYSGGPKFLTKVVRKPQRSDGSYITEVDKFGNIVYN